MQRVKFVDLGAQYRTHRDEILDAIDKVGTDGSYVLGRDVDDFENDFAAYCGSKYAVGVGNGSDALFLSLLALGVGEGDEVITAPNSFVATAWAIARTGARIVFADVEVNMNISANEIASVVTDATKAIVPVHLTGRIADMDSIQDIADSHGLYVVEDAAQSVGAAYRERRAGSFGICASFSLHPLKNLQVYGDGGVITTDDGSVYDYLLKCRNHGLVNRDECEFWGVNSRLDSIHAAVGRIKLKYLDERNRHHRAIAHRYSEALADVVAVPADKPYELPVYHRFMVRTDRRDELQNFLEQHGIETKVNYPVPLHLQPAAASLGYERGSFPIAEDFARTVLSLPIYPELEWDQVDYVIDRVRQFFAQK